MKLHFEIILDDLVAFNSYYVAHSSAVQRTLAMNRWVMALAAFIVGFLGSYAFQSALGIKPGIGVITMTSALGGLLSSTSIRASCDETRIG